MNPRVGKLRKCLVAWVAWKVIQTWTRDAKKVSFRFSANDAMPIPSSFSVGGVSECFFRSVPFLCTPPKTKTESPFPGVHFQVPCFRGSNQYFVYLFVEFPELLDSSYVFNNSSCFRWIKTMWPWKKRWISRFQTNCSRYPIPILMNIKSIQILGELSSELQDFLHVPKPSISSSYPRIRWTRDCSGGSVCGALWPLSLGGEAGRWPKKHGECIWGFPKIVVPNNHGVFLLKMIILGCFGRYGANIWMFPNMVGIYHQPPNHPFY